MDSQDKNNGEEQWVAVRHNVLCDWHVNEEEIGDDPVTKALPTPEQNKILAALSAEVRERIFPHLELVSLASGAVLYEPGESPRYVYFPIDSVASLLHTLASGASTAISLVGNDGLVGITSFMGGGSEAAQAVVLSQGSAYRLRAKQLKDEFSRHGEMLRLLLRYTQFLMTQVAQNAVCNRRHSVDQQLSGWLLHALDRLPTNQFVVTQELLANMLGVRRESITESAHELRKRGVIDYRRGHITVLNRRKLEERTCECYALARKEADRLLPKISPSLPFRGSGAGVQFAKRSVLSMSRGQLNPITAALPKTPPRPRELIARTLVLRRTAAE